MAIPKSVTSVIGPRSSFVVFPRRSRGSPVAFVSVPQPLPLGFHSESQVKIGTTIQFAKVSLIAIGTEGMITTGEYPEFSSDQATLYSARVLEIPTPRWTAYDAKYFGTKGKAEMPMTTQERAYTSPIWYTP
jgi:hypothetical protein